MALKGPRQAYGITFQDCYYRVAGTHMKTKDRWLATVHIFARKPEEDEHLAPIDGMSFIYPVDIESPLNPLAQAYDFMKLSVEEGGLGLSEPDYTDC